MLLLPIVTALLASFASSNGQEYSSYCAEINSPRPTTVDLLTWKKGMLFSHKFDVIDEDYGMEVSPGATSNSTTVPTPFLCTWRFNGLPTTTPLRLEFQMFDLSTAGSKNDAAADDDSAGSPCAANFVRLSVVKGNSRKELTAFCNWQPSIELKLPIGADESLLVQGKMTAPAKGFKIKFDSSQGDSIESSAARSDDLMASRPGAIAPAVQPATRFEPPKPFFPPPSNPVLTGASAETGAMRPPMPPPQPPQQLVQSDEACGPTGKVLAELAGEFSFPSTPGDSTLAPDCSWIIGPAINSLTTVEIQFVDFSFDSQQATPVIEITYRDASRLERRHVFSQTVWPSTDRPITAETMSPIRLALKRDVLTRAHRFQVYYEVKASAMAPPPPPGGFGQTGGQVPPPPGAFGQMGGLVPPPPNSGGQLLAPSQPEVSVTFSDANSGINSGFVPPPPSSPVVQVNVRPNPGGPMCGKAFFQSQTPGASNQVANPAMPGAWPFAALLINPNANIQCTAAIISDKAFLISASCMYRDGGIIGGIQSWSAVVGRHGTNDPKAWDNSSVLIAPPLAKVIVPRGYSIRKGKAYEHDIALIALAAPIPLKNVARAACLASKDPTPTDLCYSIAYDRSKRVLMEKKMDVFADQECPKRATVLTNFTASMICAGTSETASSYCPDNIGSPLFCYVNDSWELHGVLTKSHCQFGFAATYAKVVKYRDWIDVALSRNP